ncbi:MAG TPA: 4-hydroxy-tetrahydrodipicolinate synthase [Bacteroidia bacterium]|nr:4-hydroxy-tetrahydrodipicolinate synthase [Bacteroidia bacterium]
MKSSRKLKGTGVAITTPFHKDGSINFKGFKKLLEHLIAGKVDYLVPLGTTGESVTLTRDEKIAVLDFVLEIVDKRVPVVAGVGGNNTQEVLKCLSEFDYSGIEAILSVTPYYNKPSQKGLYQHYKMIANESPVPVILYNVPGRTGCNMLAETTLNLASDFENIVAVKEASGNMEQIMNIIRDKPEGFLVISGDDAITLPLIAAGADGVISVVENAFPKEFSEMVRLSLKGNFDKARDLHYLLSEITQLLFAEGSPSGIKSALSLMDICEDHLRLPLVNVSKSHSNKLAAAIEKIHELA